MQRPLWIHATLFIPFLSKIGRRRRAVLEHVRQLAVQWPGIIQIERLRHQFRRMPLSQHHDVRLHFLQFSARLLPKIREDHPRHVAAKTIQIEFMDPINQHARHVRAQFRISIIQPRDIRPVRHRRNNLPRDIMIVKRWGLHHHAVPCRVIRHDVDNHLESAAVRLRHQSPEIVRCAVIGIDGEIVANRIRTPDRSLAPLPPHRMNRHQPQNIHAEFLETRQLLSHAAKIAGGGERPRVYFIDHTIAQPPRTVPRHRLRSQRARQQPNETQSMYHRSKILRRR